MLPSIRWSKIYGAPGAVPAPTVVWPTRVIPGLTGGKRQGQFGLFEVADWIEVGRFCKRITEILAIDAAEAFAADIHEPGRGWVKLTEEGLQRNAGSVQTASDAKTFAGDRLDGIDGTKSPAIIAVIQLIRSPTQLSVEPVGIAIPEGDGLAQATGLGKRVAEPIAQVFQQSEQYPYIDAEFQRNTLDDLRRTACFRDQATGSSAIFPALVILFHITGQLVNECSQIEVATIGTADQSPIGQSFYRWRELFRDSGQFQNLADIENIRIADLVQLHEGSHGRVVAECNHR